MSRFDEAWAHMGRRIAVTAGAMCRVGIVAACVLGCGDDDEGARGDVICRGAECQCPGTGDCQVDCRSDCDLACTGSGDCDFTCGAGCVTECPGSGACFVDVGEASSVSCTGSGGCDIACRGDCTVDCPGSGTCTVRCDSDAECDILRCDDLVSCADRVEVCNGQCP